MQPVSEPVNPQADGNVILLVIVPILFTGGLTLLLFAAAYAQDINALLNAPELIWDFLCGAPNPDGAILPLLLTLGTMALLGGAAATGYGVYRARRRKA